MITQDEELDNLLPPGPCVDCGATFAGKLLDDRGLCIACDLKVCEHCALLAQNPGSVLCFDCTCGEDTPIRDYEREEAEDAALYKEGMRIWEKALAEVHAQEEAEREAESQERVKEADAELADREREVKSREIGRRERRQDFYDAESGQALDSAEPLAAFEMPMDGSDLALAPTAMLERKDGATLFYDGKLNFLFGSPGGGKSWLALWCIHEALLRGHRAIYWDHEDTPATLSRRSKKLGLDLADYWRDGQFKYLRPGLDGSTLAMTEAMTWIADGDGPTLMVIDSAESAGCPSDGADVAPWLLKMALPFREAGCTVLVLDHVAKRKEGRPLGPIGSQHKLARVDGAALLVTGGAWTEGTNGLLVMVNHKDRHGQLPAPNGKAVARVIGTHEGDSLHLSIVAPEAEDNIEEAYIPTLQALADAGKDGIQGQKAMRDLVVGRNNQRDKAIGDLIGMGFILKRPPERKGQKVHYSITALGLEELADSEDVEE